MTIQIGDRVRSFDFSRNREVEGELACFVEGEVVAFDHVEGCDRYRILVDRDVGGGVEKEYRLGTLVYPPVNGTPSLFGDKTDYVEVI